MSAVPAPERPQAREPEDPAGVPWWLGLAVGGGIFTFGVIGLVHNDVKTRPMNFLKYVIGSLIAHDALLAPAVLVASFVLARLLPAAVRGGVQATLVVCGAVAVMSIPVLKHEGRTPDNPSLLPHDYTENLLIVLAVILAIGITLTAVRALRR